MNIWKEKKRIPDIPANLLLTLTEVSSDVLATCAFPVVFKELREESDHKALFY